MSRIIPGEKADPQIFFGILSDLRYIHPNETPDFSYIDLNGENLSGTDLNRVIFDNAKLYKCNLTRARLVEASLQHADLHEANLSFARLEWANLDHARLERANLHRARLRSANLMRANLSEACLTYADLRDADLRGAEIIGADLTGADLRGANLLGVFLDDARIKRIKLDLGNYPMIVTGQKLPSEIQMRSRELRKNMTSQEKLIWERVRANRLAGVHFRRQQVIGSYIVDFYCHSAGLVVEIDGPIHDSQVEYDRERDDYLASRGLRILRFSNLQVDTQLEQVIDQISHYLPRPAYRSDEQ